MWAEEIQKTRMKLMVRQAGPHDVAELASKIIARARDSIGDTKWMEHVIHGVVVGLNWNRGATHLDEKTLVGLQMALSSAEMGMAPIEDLSPECRKPSSDIDSMIGAGRSVGVTDARSGMS
jgi:hypothetical protein